MTASARPHEESRRDGAVAVEIVTHSAAETRAVGVRLADVLRAGDLVILNGDLGSGKTTFAQGIGAALGVRGDVTSPTFVISRVHPTLVGGPALVHVDAYRIHDGAELDDLDLDETVEAAVTVVEWGDGVADGLAESRLVVSINRSAASTQDGTTPAAIMTDDSPRTILVQAFGPRWAGVRLAQLLTDGPA